MSANTIYSQNNASIQAFLERYRDENYILDHNSARDHKLYWARLESHQNIFTEGYVGLTNRDIKTRQKEHFQEAKTPQNHFHKKLANHDNIIWDVVEENLTDAEAMALEHFLRHEYDIGWNTLPGGGSYQRDSKQISIMVSKQFPAIFHIKEKLGISHWREEQTEEQKSTIRACRQHYYELKKDPSYRITNRNIEPEEAVAVYEGFQKENPDFQIPEVDMTIRKRPISIKDRLGFSQESMRQDKEQKLLLDRCLSHLLLLFKDPTYIISTNTSLSDDIINIIYDTFKDEMEAVGKSWNPPQNDDKQFIPLYQLLDIPHKLNDRTADQVKMIANARVIVKKFRDNPSFVPQFRKSQEPILGACFEYFRREMIREHGVVWTSPIFQQR